MTGLELNYVNFGEIALYEQGNKLPYETDKLNNFTLI